MPRSLAVEAMETAGGLCRFERGPGSDGERRAALWLAEQLRAAGREAELETVWVRPHEVPALALHALVAVAGSVFAAISPVAGAAVLGAVLLSLVLDLLGGPWLLRRLTFRRATQNVVSPPLERDGAGTPVRLIVTARYDAGRTGLVRRPLLAHLGSRAPGARALMVLAVALALAAGAARVLEDATWVGAIQLVPTVGLLLGFGLLLDAALAARSPGASDASAVGVALALAAALDEQPPERLAVHVVLAGAGTAPAAGFRAFLRARRRRWRPERTVVLHLEPCARGRPRWWTRDGPLWPLRLHPRLTELAAQAAEAESHLEARPHTGHEVTGAFAARARRWPAIAVGCLDARGAAAGRDAPGDTAEALDPEALQGAVELCLSFVDELDADLERLEQPTAAGEEDEHTGRSRSASPAS